ncbi:MAG TPA: DUF523 domain-containing protein [Terriglobia bacterium]|nr:DUF523 domain-containing protein [Terriglobia bacterium]
MRKILVSACLMGRPVRYDGRAAGRGDGLLAQWQAEGRLVLACPEIAADLAIPRPAAEIRGGTGSDVLDGIARVMTAEGENATDSFLAGANATLALALEHGISVAILKQRSPSCGSREIYDGAFADRRIPGEGVTAALLRRNGIAVFDEMQLQRAADWLTAHE